MMFRYLADLSRRLVREEHGWIVPKLMSQLMSQARGKAPASNSASQPVSNSGGEISDRSRTIIELSMEYQKMFPGPVNQQHQARWFAERGAPIGYLFGGIPGAGKLPLQPGYTPPREGGVTGGGLPTPVASNQFINPPSWEFERAHTRTPIVPEQNWKQTPGGGWMDSGLWSKPAQPSGGYLQPPTQTGSYGASNPWADISKGVTNLASGSSSSYGNASSYTKPRSSVTLDPQPTDPWSRPKLNRW